LAEAATLHPDRTFSLLRAGLTEFASEATEGPIPFHAGLLVQIRPEAGDPRGAQRVEVLFRSRDGGAVVPLISGEVHFAEGEYAEANLLCTLSAAFPGPGRYFFIAMVAGKEVGSLHVTAKYSADAAAVVEEARS
jgi:hypothetical protein